MDLFFIIISSLLSALNAEAQITATILPDQDYNAPLDESALISFNCTATGMIVAWLVDGIEVSAGSTLPNRGVSTTPVEMIGAGGVHFSSLSIPARIQNDNTSIQCSALRVNPTISNNSKLVFLKIQGLLSPPNLMLSEADGSCERTLNWDAPETLDLTDIEPDILYYTVCYNLTVDLTCQNVSSFEKREFRFTEFGDPLLFTVTAVNVVGKGNASSIDYQPSSCPTTILIDTTSATTTTANTCPPILERTTHAPLAIDDVIKTQTDRTPPDSNQRFYNNHGLIIGGIFASAVLMFAIGSCAIIFYWLTLRKQRHCQVKCQAVYDEPRPISQIQVQANVEMEECPAYEVVDKQI